MRSLKLSCLASTAICLSALSNPAFAQVDDEIVTQEPAKPIKVTSLR